MLHLSFKDYCLAFSKFTDRTPVLHYTYIYGVWQLSHGLRYWVLRLNFSKKTGLNEQRGSQICKTILVFFVEQRLRGAERKCGFLERPNNCFGLKILRLCYDVFSQPRCRGQKNSYLLYGTLNFPITSDIFYIESYKMEHEPERVQIVEVM